MHVEDGVLLAYVDGELPSDERSELAEHLRECLPCRRSLAEVRGRAGIVTAALAGLDRPVPLNEAWTAVQTALGRDPAPATDLPSRRRPPAVWGRSALARAAGLVLLLAGGAAAAVVPGSPVRSWLFGEAESPAATAAAVVEAGASGLFTSPVDGAVELAISAPAGTEIIVEQGGRRAGVSGPASTAYDSPRDGLVRVQATEGPLRVELPAGLAGATLRVNGRVVLTIRDGAAVDVPSDAEGDLATGGEPLRFRVR